MKDLKGLPADSLGSLDSFGNRIFIYPASVSGIWHKRRQIFQSLLLIVFLVLPWIKIHDRPAILLDLPHRQFALFGLTFWAHDGPILFFVFAILALSMALVTAVWGRVWCGWACPQTVFIERVFRQVETWIEGTHLKRRQLNEGPWTFVKMLKKLTKQLLFVGMSWFIGNTFLAYFVSMDRLLHMIQTPPSENWTSFLVMMFVTVVVWFDFGWFREQFCIVMCPYGRFQSVLMDTQSKAVVYDSMRGEPRKGLALKEGQKTGDCVNCLRCVAVCPTAIDIRRGVQMECIACTACIDACDEVMTKIKKPTGLIRYGSESELALGAKTQGVRLRVILYSVLIGLLTLGLGVVLALRTSVEVHVLRGIDKPYSEIQAVNDQPMLANHFQLLIENHSFSAVQMTLNLSEEFKGAQVISPLAGQLIEKGKITRQHFFIEFPKKWTESDGRRDVELEIQISSAGKIETRHENIRLVGPRDELK